MKNIKLLSIVIFAGLFTACEKEIDLEMNIKDNFMVLNAIINESSVIQCDLSLSTTLLEQKEYYGINDAVLTLYVDDEKVEELEYDGGKYVSGYTLKEGQEIMITGEHSTYEKIKAKTSIPTMSNAEIKSIYFSKENYSDYGYGNLNVKCEVVDPKGADYYRLEVWVPDIVYDEETDAFYCDISSYSGNTITSIDPVLNGNTVSTNDDFIDLPPNIYSVFDDTLFDGDSYTIDFEIEGTSYSSLLSDEEISEFLTAIIVDVQKISKDLYLYYKTVDAYGYYDESPFSEPVEIYYNVDGGAGILGCYTSNEISWNP